MTAVLAIAAGALLGVAGALAHLGALAFRARLVVRGATSRALALMPLGLALPAAAVALAAQLGKGAVFAAAIALLGARTLVLSRLSRAPAAGEAPAGVPR